uniref:Uncharacterized protein n=1 Tax=Anguilla anguilla TaxID=7936 RepID=A0A0E9V994_ANGAN
MYFSPSQCHILVIHRTAFPALCRKRVIVIYMVVDI